MQLKSVVRSFIVKDEVRMSNKIPKLSENQIENDDGQTRQLNDEHQIEQPSEHQTEQLNEQSNEQRPKERPIQ